MISQVFKGVVLCRLSQYICIFDPKSGPQHIVPAGKENNWVQTNPGEGWNVIFRLYSPLKPWYDKTWRPSEIELVK
jgi:hypothetical protein